MVISQRATSLEIENLRDERRVEFPPSWPLVVIW
jgi:hypothetical protein